MSDASRSNRAPRLAPMSALSRDDVAHLPASPASTSPTPSSTAWWASSGHPRVRGQVQQVAADGVAPMSHPLPLTNVTRPDVVRPSLGAEAALAGAPEAEQQRFSVPRILDED